MGEREKDATRDGPLERGSEDLSNSVPPESATAAGAGRAAHGSAETCDGRRSHTERKIEEMRAVRNLLVQCSFGSPPTGVPYLARLGEEAW